MNFSKTHSNSGIIKHLKFNLVTIQMIQQAHNFNRLPSNAKELKQNFTTMNLSDVFSNKTDTYLNEFKLFTAINNYIPNFIHERGIDCLKANKWFAEEYKSEIKDYYFDKIYQEHAKKAELDNIFHFIYEDLIVNFDIPQSKVRFLFKKTEISMVEHIISKLKKFKKRKPRKKPEISLLVNADYSLDTKSFKIEKPRLSIQDNYNDDFQEVHQTILKRLSKKNDKGLVLLHGKPGTGKTSYIRYLLTMVKKNVIFLPPNMAGQITNPDLISSLIDNSNSIFVIEDAENIVIDREMNGSSPVSAILNISDGLLADCLNIQIICSFNTDISQIDSALMRKGRLIAKYEFKELAEEKAQSLSKKLGFNSSITSPMTLTAIYNQEETDFQQLKKQKTIGFFNK